MHGRTASLVLPVRGQRRTAAVRRPRHYTVATVIQEAAMQVELIEIRDHLSRFAPFDELPEETLDEPASQVQVRYYKAGTSILEPGDNIADLHYIRSGAVEVF